MQRKFAIPVMIMLFLAAAMCEAVRLRSLSMLNSSDVWWHLSSGIWILYNHALPRNGIFSQSASLPWVTACWFYDVLLAGMYRLLELRAIPVLAIFLKTGLAIITFLLAGGCRGRFWRAVALSAVAQFVLGGVAPGPEYFSILFFGITVLVILASRRSGNVRPLWWLAPLFVVWANVDVQFVYGSLLLVLFVMATAVENMNGKSVTVLPLKRTAVVTAICLAGSLITPYFLRNYEIYLAGVTSTANRYLPDFQAMSFHRPQDYTLLLLTMGAFLALGRRRSRDWFQIALLVLAAMLSFYAQRNTWMAALVSVAVIGEALPQELGEAFQAKVTWNRNVLAGAGAVVIVLIALICLRIPRQREALLAKVGESYPVAASNYIQEHGLPQPLFNAYEWGGFLTWYLPQYPVAIDGRTDLYGADFVVLYSKAMNADVPYTAFSPMSAARTLLLPKSSVLGEALSTVSGFKVAYSDDVSWVLIHEDDSVAASQ